MAGDSIVYPWVTELTTLIGPRPAGSDNDHRAAAWAADKFRALGFENVQIQTFPLTAWVRGSEHAEITSPSPQPLVITALGGSPPTSEGGLEAQIVVFASMEDLLAAPLGSLTGKIAFVNRRMVATQDLSGYAAVAAARVRGPGEAAKRGAVGFLIRSIGTDTHRLAHTGTAGYVEGRVPVPSFAISIPDADQIERMSSSGQTVRARLFSTASLVQGASSQNVIAEIRGRERPQEVVLLGAHLDSWDLGTGASDDGAGCAIITAAAKMIHDLPQRPRRTVRVVLFGAEEVAQPMSPFFTAGGSAYARKYAAELPDHVIISESDTGADRIYAAELPTSVSGKGELQAAVSRVLGPVGVLSANRVMETGADINPLLEAGVPSFGLYQDLTRYFELHHTADDTLDKIDRHQFDQAVAAWAAVTWMVADSEDYFPRHQPEGTGEPTVRSLLNGSSKKH